MPHFQWNSRPTATCALRDRSETSRSTPRLGGASASSTQLIGPMSFSHVQGTSCAIIDSHAATDQTIMTGVTISAPLRRHVSASNTVISGTATVTYCGPADGIINGSAADKTAPATSRGDRSVGCGARTFQNPPRPTSTIAATTAALKAN